MSISSLSDRMSVPEGVTVPFPDAEIVSSYSLKPKASFRFASRTSSRFVVPSHEARTKATMTIDMITAYRMNFRVFVISFLPDGGADIRR